MKATLRANRPLGLGALIVIGLGLGACMGDAFKTESLHDALGTDAGPEASDAEDALAPDGSPSDAPSEASVTDPDATAPEAACDNDQVLQCYSGPSGTAEAGICKAGQKRCVEGQWGVCEGELTPESETCNGQDDNCDGTIDSFEGACYTGPSGTQGVGICKAGTGFCENGAWTLCPDQVLPERDMPGDGLDNDCDNQVDPVECEEKDGHNEWGDCGSHCQESASDHDCDGIPDIGDPGYDQCNDLLFWDSFAEPLTVPGWRRDGSWGPLWNAQGNVQPGPCPTTWYQPTLLQIPAGGRLELIGPPKSVTQPSYLTQVRFLVGAPGPMNTWTMDLASAVVGTSLQRACELRITGATTYELHAFGGSTLQSSARVDGSLPQGQALLLQGWQDQDSYTCELIDASSLTRLADTTVGVALAPLDAEPGGVILYTAERAIDLDYVRLYALPQTTSTP